MRAPSPPFVLSEAEQQQSLSYGVLQAMSGPAPPSPITTSSSSSSLSSRQKRTRRHSSRHARRSRSHGHRSRRRTDKRRRHRSNSSNSNTSATASSRSSSASSSQVSTRHSSLRKDSAQQRHRSSRGHHHSHHRRHHRHSSSTNSSSSRHRHHRSRKEALLHAERYNYGGTDGEVDGGGNGVLPLDITSANLSYTSDLNVAATTTGEAVAPRLDPVEKDIPLSDWVCGVCSNLNSMQRSACYRCAVSYAESQRAKPCEEIVLVPVPAEKTEMAVAQVVARVSSQGGGNATLNGGVATSQVKTGGNPVEGMIIAQYYDAKQKALYLRFVSVAEATRALVFCRCQLTLSDVSDCSAHRDGDKDGEGIHASDAPVLPLSCRMTFSRANKTARVDTAGLSRREMRQAMNAVLDQPKVKSSGKDDSSLPRELRAQNWQPPASFASAAEEKAYLTLLSDHWAQLSAAQREYYEVRVKQSLTSKASDSQALNTISKDTTTSSQTAATTGTVSTGSLSAVESLRRRMEEKKNALKKAAEAAASTATTTASSSDSSTPVAAPTSNSLALLKQRLAEKKAKLTGDSAASTTTTSNDTTTSAGSTITTLAVTTNTDDNSREATKAQAMTGDDTAEPVTLYDNFPLPPRYVGWAARADATPPRLEQTWHIPLAIAQRVLPPALLKQPQQPRLNTYSRGH